jgi:hypothetical protein
MSCWYLHILSQYVVSLAFVEWEIGRIHKTGPSDLAEAATARIHGAHSGYLLVHSNSLLVHCPSYQTSKSGPKPNMVFTFPSLEYEISYLKGSP